MAPIHTELSRQMIKNQNNLKVMFNEKSPIPGFVYHELASTDNVSLIKARFTMSTLAKKAENLENFAKNKKDDLTGDKTQTLFIILLSGKTFKYDFQGKSIADVITQYSDVIKDTEIEKIVIVTKYNWRKTNTNIIKKRYVSILMFDT